MNEQTEARGDEGMAPVRAKKRYVSSNPELGLYLRQAMRRKGEELGRAYTFRDIERDAAARGLSLHFAHARNIAAGLRPTVGPESIHVLALVIAPYFDEATAMLLAGHAPKALRQAAADVVRMERAVDERKRAGHITEEIAELERAFQDALAEVQAAMRRLFAATRPEASVPQETPLATAVLGAKRRKRH